MKTNRIHLCVAGAACALTLGVTLAQDPAPDAAAAPAAGDANPAPAPVVEVPAPQRALNSRSSRLSRPPFRSLRATPGAPASVAPLSAGDATETPDETGAEPKSKTTTPSLKFDNAPTDIILQAYAQETGKTLLIAPDAPKANITLKSQPDVVLSREEFIEAIEVVLSMNGIVLEPFGEKFMKVLARKTVRTDGIQILMESPEKGHPEKNRVVSQMIQLKAITAEEAQKALEGFKKPDGLFQMFERTNSILVTDTQENINRMLEIVKFIDQPLVVLEEVNVRAIRYAKAEEIKKRLEEIVAESQKQTQAKEEIKPNVSGAPGFSRTTSSRPLPSGLTRLRGQQQPEPAAKPNENLATLISDADRGMIRGKVQILADERSNQLIIVTRADNMKFFDKVIQVLDIETAPDVRVKIIRLKHATVEGKDGSKGVAEILNELIGNASASKKSSQEEGKAKTRSSTDSAPANQNLTENKSVPTLAQNVVRAREGGAPSDRVGELSKDNITILADPRINGLVIMASPSDLAVLETIINELDIELSQVLIETVLVQVQLTDAIKTGIDWVQQKVEKRNNISYVGGGGSGDSEPQRLVEGTAQTIGKVAGLKYWLSLGGLNLDAVLSASEEDSVAKVLSSPVLMTVDNKEAVMESTEMRYLYKGVRYSGSSYDGKEVPDYEQRDFGLTIKITPRINPNDNVVLTVDETFENLGTEQFIPGAGGTSSTNGSGGGWTGGYFPTINKRKLQADVSVKNGQTIILGGLVTSSIKRSDSGIPYLKNIPYIGRYLFGKTEDKEERTELLVFLTPYVLKSSEAAQDEAIRRKKSLSTNSPWQDNGWSTSVVADPLSGAQLLRKKRDEWANEDEQAKAKEQIEKEEVKRNKELLRRAKERQSEINQKQKAAVPVPDAAAAAAPAPDAAEPVIRVTDSVEILGKGAGSPPQAATPETPKP